MTNVLTVTAQEIVNGALRLIGEIDANQSIGAVETRDGLEALNYMVKSWQAQGLHLWTKTEGILFLDVGRENYDLGPTGNEAGLADDFVNTEMAVAGVISDQTLTLNSTTGMEGASNILNPDPSESTQGWTVVSGTLAIVDTSLEVSNTAGVSGKVERTITDFIVGRTYRVIVDFIKGLSPSIEYIIKDGTTILGLGKLSATGTSKFEFIATQTSHIFEIVNGDAVAMNETTTTLIQILDNTTGDLIGIRLDDNTRQWSKIVEVLNFTQVFIADGLTSASTVNRSVFSIPNLIPRPVRLLQLRRDKIGTTDEIEANQWSREEYFAQPNKSSQGTINNWYYSPQLTNGRIYIWQTANDVDQVARFTFERPIDISNSTSDNPDFPSEWFRTLKYNLAVDIAPEYRIPQDRLDRLRLKASELLENSLGFDFETDSMDMQPDLN